MNDRPDIEYNTDLLEYYEMVLSPYPNGVREILICAPSILDRTQDEIQNVGLEIEYIGFATMP